MQNNTSLRHIFNQVAHLYNEIRPRYPEALFDALIKVTALSPQAKLIEIGPGTGQATKPLATRGYDITAIELGEALADVARQELRPYPNVHVVTGAFEDVPLPAETYDLVYVATAFHWVKPNVRYAKPHRILKPNGHLAIIDTHHVSDEQGDTFFVASQPIHERYVVHDKSEAFTLPTPDSIEPAILDETLFQLVHFQRFPIAVTYTAQQYAQLLNTYSPNLALSEPGRTAFLNDIRDLIDQRFNGSIRKQFVMSLTVAQKV